MTLYTILFLVSGGAGLIYQVVWERLLEIYFGVTMTSITLIVSAYMAGLGLGSLLGGRIAQKLRTPLFSYGLLEIGIGICGAITPFLIGWVGRGTAGSPYWLVFIISFCLLIFPTLLMGMTLPLMTQAFVDRVETSGRVIGMLYGINTFGAALGCATAGYVLIGRFGFDGTSWLAVILNVGVGLIAILTGRRAGVPVATSATKSSNVTQHGVRWNHREILVVSFFVGFIGLGYEMLWFRILHIVNKNTAYGFASLLSVFLIGLALGGYYWGRRADRSSNMEKLFWQVEIAAGITASLAFLILWYSLQNRIGFPGLGDFMNMQKPVPPFVEVDGEFVFSRRALLTSLTGYFLPIMLVVLPASFILGGGLTILDRIAIRSPEVAGRKVGNIHLANIIGSVFGSLVISFWMLPMLGTEWTHKALVLLGMVFPIFYFTGEHVRRLPDLKSVAILGLSLTLLILLPGKNRFYRSLFETATGNQAITQESSDSVLALTTDGNAGSSFLWIGGETNSFYPPDGTYESRGILCAGASRPKRILIVGMGGGVAARFFQTIPGVKEIVIVELMEDLGGFLNENVPMVKPIFNDPRVRYVVDDGRRYLYANPQEKFDLIFIDPLRWYSSGHNNLYSFEAMLLYQAHLAEDGVFCAYVDQTHSLPFTIAQVFPYVDQYKFRTVIAADREILYDIAYMDDSNKAYLEMMAEGLKPGTSDYLEPRALLSGLTRDRDQIMIEEDNSPILYDLKPGLEYYFFNTPIKRPVWLKSDLSKVLFPRLLGCDEYCQQEINDFKAQSP